MTHSSTSTFPLTTEQILALAPDAASAKAGRVLLNPNKWPSLGCNSQGVWGECQGSGAKPYQTMVDLSGPAFKCSCPSRKFPCKHGLGLLLLASTNPNLFKNSTPPQWMHDWLVSRAEKTQRKVAQANEPKMVDKEAQAKRRASREAKVSAGLAALELWLQDLMRSGLMTVPQRSLRDWDNLAARLVDAQAPGLARWVRLLSGVPTSGPGWQERFAQEVARLHLVTQAYQHITTLPVELQADVREAIGWNQNQDELLSQVGIRDVWQVLGRRVEQEDRLKVHSTWLLGQTTAKAALVLQFAAPGQMMETNLLPGFQFEAELVFYVSAYPQRALVKQHATAQLIHPVWGFSSIAEAQHAYSLALSHLPWLERFPAYLKAVFPIMHAEQWWLRDTTKTVWPITPRFTNGWSLAALSGGYAIEVFGEWNGINFLPLSVWTDGKLVNL